MQRETLRLLSLLRSAARTLQERTSAVDGSLQQQLQRCFHSSAGGAAHKPALDQGPLLLLQGRHICPRMEAQQARQRLGSLLLPCRAAASASRPSLAAAVSSGSKVHVRTLHMSATLGSKQPNAITAACRLSEVIASQAVVLSSPLLHNPDPHPPPSDSGAAVQPHEATEHAGCKRARGSAHQPLAAQPHGSVCSAGPGCRVPAVVRAT